MTDDTNRERDAWDALLAALISAREPGRSEKDRSRDIDYAIRGTARRHARS